MMELIIFYAAHVIYYVYFGNVRVIWVWTFCNKNVTVTQELVQWSRKEKRIFHQCWSRETATMTCQIENTRAHANEMNVIVQIVIYQNVYPFRTLPQ